MILLLLDGDSVVVTVGCCVEGLATGDNDVACVGLTDGCAVVGSFVDGLTEG